MSNFRIKLVVASRVEPLDVPREYSEELDAIVSLLDDACEGLAERGIVEFLAWGCSGERWLVDVETDLPVVVEQLPRALNQLKTSGRSHLGFYEQGIEKEVDFEVRGRRKNPP